MSNHLKLNLGCGKDLRQGYVNVDIIGGDVQVDLWKFPWPWPDNGADEILMNQVLEHLPDTYGTMAEVKRILKPGGTFKGAVPYCFSHTSFIHPQHYRHFHPQSFGMLAEHFDMELILAECYDSNATRKHKIRSLIPKPVRELLAGLLLNMFDEVRFELRKKNAKSSL